MITVALFDHNQTNSSLNIEFYQCNTNKTLVNSTIISTDKIFDSCHLDCCTKNDSNQTIYSNTCQVSVQSPIGVCLGRLCYSGECDQFLSLMNVTFKQKATVFSSFSSIPWSSFVNSTRIIWPLWKDKSALSIHYSILILLLIANLSLTLITLFIVIKSIRHAKIIAKRKLRRYSLF